MVSKPGQKCRKCGRIGHWANTCIVRGGGQKRYSGYRKNYSSGYRKRY